MSDTQPTVSIMSSADRADFEEAYKQWNKAHARIQSAPPTQGRDYIKHAANLLTLLEPISEINPFAKAAVGAFKLVVLFEQDRRGNDARSEAVILAQADVMRVLLDVDDLTKRNANSQASYTASSLAVIFEDIQKQIKLCHNCMNTYDKQHKIVKLCNAREWKDKFMGYVSTFNDLRNRLMTALHLQTASNVSKMADNVNQVLNLLFTTHNTKEKEDIKRINIVSRETLERDPKAMQRLLLSTGYSSMAEDIPETPTKVMDDNEKRGTSKPDGRKVESASVELQVSELQQDMCTPVDTLCDKNMKYFEGILELYTINLKKTINDSADRVIHSLSGPYERLQHKDLRELWKEMKWIFCVETGIFAMALFEYYQDLYAHPHVVATAPREETGTDATCSQNTVKLSSGPKFHPDAWTLPYLQSLTAVVATIDDDNSGYIRISEANRFTSRIPEGWTLPQYCAYLVEGCQHENAIYRHRIIRLRNNMHEMHAQLLPGNRYTAALVMQDLCNASIDKLALRPQFWSETSLFAPALELHGLVEKKIREQDMGVRKHMKKLQYNLDKTTTSTLFHGQDLEQYIFPLAYVLIELLLDFHHFCCTSTVDLQQWMANIVKPFHTLRSMIDDRIKDLKSKERTTDLLAYHRGIWSWFDLPDIGDMKGEQKLEFVVTAVEDIDQHRNDMSFIKKEFPLPAFGDDLVIQTYPTREKFSESNNTSRVPEDEDEDEDEDEVFFDLPFTRLCNKCHRELKSSLYHCLQCDDFDLCQDCYDKPFAEHEVGAHYFDHPMALAATYLQESRCLWIGQQNEREEAQFRSILDDKKMTLAKRSDNIYSDEPGQFGNILDSGDGEDPYEGFEGDNVPTAKNTRELLVSLLKEHLYNCCVCGDSVTLETRFFICGEYSCSEGRAVCHKCAHRQHDKLDTHFWWHSLLPFDKRLLDAPKSFTGAPVQTLSFGPPKSDELLANATNVETKILAVEQKIGALEVKLDERLSGIEAMLHKLLGAGAGGASPDGRVTLPPTQQGRQGRGGSQHQQHGRDHDRKVPESVQNGAGQHDEVNDYGGGGEGNGEGDGESRWEVEIDDHIRGGKDHEEGTGFHREYEGEESNEGGAEPRQEDEGVAGSEHENENEGSDGDDGVAQFGRENGDEGAEGGEGDEGDEEVAQSEHENENEESDGDHGVTQSGRENEDEGAEEW